MTSILCQYSSFTLLAAKCIFPRFLHLSNQVNRYFYIDIIERILTGKNVIKETKQLQIKSNNEVIGH